MSFFHLKQQYHTVEAFDTAAKLWDFEFIQLDRGIFFADLVQFGDHEVVIGTCHWNRYLQQRGSAPASFYTFAIHGPKSVPHVWRYISCPLNSIIIFPENRELSSISPPGYETITISVEESYLEQLTLDLGFPELHKYAKKGEVLLAGLEEITTLKNYLHTLCWIAKKPGYHRMSPLLNEEIKWSITKLLLRALVSSTTIKLSKTSVKKSRVISRVLDYLENNNGENTSVPTLCKVAEVSERTLRNTFNDILSIGPKRYQQYRKLNLVRRELMRSESGPLLISDIANANGFWHMGQFAADYSSLFGELPSETIKKITTNSSAKYSQRTSFGWDRPRMQ